MVSKAEQDNEAKALIDWLRKNDPARLAELMAPLSPVAKSLERSIVAWSRKWLVGMEVVAMRIQGMQFEAAVTTVMEVHGRSRRYVIDAAVMAKLSQKRLRPTSGLKLKPYKSTPDSKARDFIMAELGNGPRKRAAIVQLAAKAGIKIRTLERAYQEIGLRSPGKRLTVWQLSDRARKRLRRDQEISRQLEAWKAGGK